jgi:hypothetical protein
MQDLFVFRFSLILAINALPELRIRPAGRPFPERMGSRDRPVHEHPEVPLHRLQKGIPDARSPPEVTRAGRGTSAQGTQDPHQLKIKTKMPVQLSPDRHPYFPN